MSTFLNPFSPNRRMSCGVLIVNAERELLLCHVTGQQHWDLPKGGMAAGESPLETALRETEEETGLALAAEVLIDLGRFDYRPRKALHLFATLMPRLDVATLGCTSHFSHARSGQRLPEMDDYGWFDFTEVPRHTSRQMADVLAGQIELDRLLARLTGRTATPASRDNPMLRMAQTARPASNAGLAQSSREP
jgi:8-oxo-dGTP pyrophosphatase MutT (NUDIX family)